MKVCYIFGYGSLISAESINRTLERKSLTINDLIPCYLKGYERSWTYLHHVYSFEKSQNVKGVFLNIQPEINAITNGVIFKVNADEFARLQKREEFYSAVNVAKNILLNTTQLTHYQSNIPIYTFVSKESNLVKNTMSDLYIFETYEEIMKPACLGFGGDFWRFYLGHTLPSDLPRLEGYYTTPK